MLETLVLVLIALIITLVVLLILYWREKVNAAHVPFSMRFKCKVRKYKFNKRKVYVIQKRKKHDDSKKAILYFHGGAYIANIAKEHWALLRDIADVKDYTFILPDYPLLPANNYEDVFEFVMPLYDKIVSEFAKKGIREEDILIMGDSAGGGITLALTEKLAKDGREVPKKIIIISPWLDISLSNDEIVEVQKRDKLLNYKPLKLVGEVYSNFGKLDNYLVSPIYGDVSRLKEVVMFIGTDDILFPDVNKFAEKIEKYKEDNNLTKEDYPKVKVITGEGMEHIWVVYKKYRNSEEYKILLGEL